MVTKVLAVGVHPDNVELGCGATLLNKIGHKVHTLVLTRGEASGDHEVREIECKKSAEMPCEGKVHFGNIHDTKITDIVDTIMKTENMINHVKPDITFTQSSRDGHQDHSNAALASFSKMQSSHKNHES